MVLGNRRMFSTGLTMMEALVALVIIAVLTGILTPVFLKAKRSIQVSNSVAKLRELHVALEVYRANWDAKESYSTFDSYYAVALPPSGGRFSWDDLGVGQGFWESPCGRDRTIFDTGLNLVEGWVTPTYVFYDPANFGTPGDRSGNYIDYKDYLPTYRENVVTFVDPYCNPPGTSFADPTSRKRGIAMTLGGQLFNRVRVGIANRLQWFSDPPDY